jgi:carbonic anhydrase/acetyltransferase-like protein (isoleucine patch superfamily)
VECFRVLSGEFLRVTKGLRVVLIFFIPTISGLVTAGAIPQVGGTMAIESYDGISPTIPASAFVAASADIIGRVTLGEEASVWYQATLRGDINEITIGARSNIQDNVVVHLADDYGCHIGELVTIGHSAVIHACTIHDEVLVGMGAIILDGAVIGERSIIGAGALVTGGTIIPPGSLVIGTPAKVVRSLSEEEQAGVKTWAEKYVTVSRKYLVR